MPKLNKPSKFENDADFSTDKIAILKCRPYSFCYFEYRNTDMMSWNVSSLYSLVSNNQYFSTCV